MKTIEELQKLVVQGFTDWEQFGHVNTKEKGDLVLFNYNIAAQLEGKWTWFERVSRGLILDKKTGEVVARPYDKFFNWHENHVPKPNRRKRQVVSITEKMDGCFLGNTKLNLWNGGTITIREVVSKKLPVILKGMDEQGNIVPTKVIDWFDNGTKEDWILLTVGCDVSDKSGTRMGNNIPITPNHHVYVNGKYKPASELKIGDILTSSQREPSDEVLHVIKSGLLGDGSLCKSHNAYKYMDGHKVEHEEYVDLITHWLGECSIKKDYRISGYGSSMCRAITKAYKSLHGLYAIWYSNGEKRLPEDLSWMDDFSVAKWYMDDGSLMHTEKQKDRVHFSTNSFSENDCKRLANKLNEMYGVCAVVYFSRGWNIRINYDNGSIHKFWMSIAPFIVPCMRYKLPDTYKIYPYVILRGRGKEKITSIETKILSISNLKLNSNYFNAGRKGFDIKTETGNYFCKGILVHNSLGILYRDPAVGVPKIATRGSFDSEQALIATHMLYEDYGPDLREIPYECTLLFEIIYPENRIVVDYGDRRALVLIGARNRFTGEHYEPDFLYDMAEYFGFHTPTDYGELISEANRSVDHITAFIENWPANQEGLVVQFNNGSFWKFKSPEYCRVHKLLSTISFKNVLEAVKTGTIDDVMELIPEHFEGEVKAIIQEIEEKVLSLQDSVRDYFERAPKDDRKEYALWVKDTCPELAVYMFPKLDGRDITPLILKHAFRNREDSGTHLIGDS